MHVFMHNPGGQGLYLPFNALGWVFASIVMGLGLWQVAQRQAIVFNSMQAWLWAGAMLLLLPMAYPGSDLTVHAVPRLLGLFGGLLFLFALYQLQLSRSARYQLLHLLLGGIAIEALLGLTQFYLLTPGNWVGYNTEANRPHGIFQQPNVMASFMATGIALAAWLQARGQQDNTWLRGLRYGVIVAASVLLVLLQSRVGQLGGLIALLLLVPQLQRQRQLAPVLALVGLGVALGLGSQYLLQTNLRGTEIYQSAGGRSIIWPFTAKLIAESPWSGWGYGSFEPTFLERYMAAKALDPSMAQAEPNIGHPHNEFLYWAMEGGVAGMLGLVLMMGAVFWRLKRAGWLAGMGLLALVAPILLHTQTEYPFYHAIALWWTVLLLVYVLDAEVEDDLHEREQGVWRDYGHRPKFLMRMVAILIPLIVVPFMASSVHTAWVVTNFERNGRGDPTLLQDIINPLPWQGRIELIVNSLRLRTGLLGLDKEALEDFVIWGESYVRHSPRPVIYANMVLALQALERVEAAEAMRARGLKLYPGDPMISKRVTLPTPIAK